MPKTATPLQRAAAAQDDAAKTKKARGLLASLATLLGMKADAPSPDARMHKVTEKQTKVRLEESDDDSEEEEEEGGDTSDTGNTMDSDADGSDAGSQDEERGEAEEEEGEAEEEEEKALAGKRAKAFAAADAAYRAAVKGDPNEAALLLRAPKRVEREVRKATGAKGIDAALTMLSRARAKNADADADAIKKQAALDARLRKVEANDRAGRVNAIVEQAKTDGRAPTKALRVQLREHGNAHGTKALRALVAALPVVNASERIPKEREGGRDGHVPTAEEQAKMMEHGMAGLSAKDREEFKAILAEKQTLNGAAKREEA